MKINGSRLKLYMARSCFSFSDLLETAQISKNTLRSAMCEKNLKPKTVGKIARALNCDVTEIIKED